MQIIMLASIVEDRCGEGDLKFLKDSTSQAYTIVRTITGKICLWKRWRVLENDRISTSFPGGNVKVEVFKSSGEIRLNQNYKHF